MVRTYAFNPSTSTKNFSNIELIESNAPRGPAKKLIGDQGFDPQQDQSRRSPNRSVGISRTQSFPTPTVLPRVNWTAQARRQSYINVNFDAENRYFPVSALPYNPDNARGLIEYHPVASNAQSLYPLSPHIDYEELRYLEQEKAKLLNPADPPLILDKNMASSYAYQNQTSSNQTPNYGVDYEKYLRAQEREQKQQYLRDLTKQAEQQKKQRLITEVDYGGYEYEKDLMKTMKNNQASTNNEDLPPWLRGNPQPKNGIRGSNNNIAAPAPDNYGGGVMRRERSLPMDFNTGLGMGSFGAGIGQSSYGQPNGGYGSAYSLAGPTEESGYSYGNKAPEFPKKTEEVYDPWGKGGAGAPIRDKDGKLVADRSKLQQSWNKMLDTNVPHNISPNSSMNISRGNNLPVPNNGAYGSYSTPSYSTPSYAAGSSSFPSSNGGVLSEKDAYKRELQQQIDERKRQRDLEKQREMEEEARDRASFEKYAEKQRQEIEAEKDKQRRKHEMAQQKFENGPAVGKVSNDSGPQRPRLAQSNRNNQPDDGLEWWERTPQDRKRAESALLPTMKGKMAPPSAAGSRQSQNKPPSSAVRSSTLPSAARKPPTAASGSRRPSLAPSSRSNNMPPTPPPNSSFESAGPLLGQQADDSPPMRNKQYKPRSAAVKNEAILRQLSAMRERLNKEQIRVKSALRRKEYGEELFSDEDAPTAEYLLKDDIKDLDSRMSSAYQPRRTSNQNRQPRAKSVRSSGAYDDLFDGGRKQAQNAGSDEDPPLVKLIKSSRTSASNFARTPASGSSRRRSGSFGGVSSTRRSAFSDDDSPTLPRRNGGARGQSDNESEPDAIVDSYLTRRKK